ncbi:SDR family NAD(P)-dependent oxidoreductase [Streptomyces canus]|uniref:SDR family NAD(P)-dependent oxidoreductase n=1 Tax=Streptomyces canus TaxID=58343 RepID=UPI003722DF8B
MTLRKKAVITGIGGGLGRDHRFHGITLSPRAATELNARGGGLDVLVSNAGSLTPGPLEVLPPHQIRHDVEVDVVGAIAGVNGFMPAPRTTRGRIVHLSAFAAHFPFPAGEGRARRVRGGDFRACPSRWALVVRGDFVLVRAGCACGGGPRRRGPACGGSRSR